MISGGNATVFVSNMDRAIDFYTGVLKLRLQNRFGDSWATIDAGKGFIIGLHPASPKYPPPGVRGATMIGLETAEPLERVLGRIQSQGVQPLGPVQTTGAGSFAHIHDPDGNEIYLWEKVEIPEENTPEQPELVSEDCAPASR